MKDNWDVKYLRESVFMPFGSMCNLIGQAYQGKGITIEELENLTKKAFVLALTFVSKAYDEAGEQETGKADLPMKNQK